MVPALATITVLSWGIWVPVAQIVRGIDQRARTLYVTIGNFFFASAALLIGGGHISIDWRGFWLPFGGGVIWTAGNYCAFRATSAIGLARAAGTWSSLNIVVAFVWGATIFGELNRFDAGGYAALAFALTMVFAGVLLIVASQGVRGGDGGSSGPGAADRSPFAPPRPALGRRGLLWAAGAGLLWGTYFIPAQWADIPARVANYPLAIGMLVGGLALALPAGGHAIKLSLPSTGIEMTSGVLWGIGNLALLGLVSRIGSGAGFTIAQLSLIVNAAIGIWIFKVPKPGTPPARVALAGVVLAGIGGCVIGVIR
jgi:glucose uptake protein